VSAILRFPQALPGATGRTRAAEDEHVCHDAAGLAGFFDDLTTVALWTRDVPPLVAIGERLAATNFQSEFALEVGTAWSRTLRVELSAAEALCGADVTRLVDDVAMLVELFEDLVGARHVGLRLRTLDHSMCPRFHIDRVPLRLLCTYAGPGTEWLTETDVDRRLLRALVDEDRCDPAMRKGAVVRRAAAGQVALLKGDAWQNRQGRGAVHRSPAAQSGAARLLLSLEAL